MPSKSAAQKPSHDNNNNNNESISDSTTVTATNSSASSHLALRDSSNSFRPTSQIASDPPLNKSSAILNKDNANRAFTGSDKPLNIAALTRPKNKKNGESNTPGAAKKQKLSNVDRLKENIPESATRSPRTRPMSPSRLPRASGLPPSLMFTHQEPVSISSVASDAFSSNALQISERSGHSQTHTVNESSTTTPSFTRPSVLSSSNTLDITADNPLSSFVSPRPRSGTLDPSRREIFPLRMQQEHVDLTERNSLSPPPPAQPYLSEEHRDYHIPIETNEAENHPEHERRLRRATKRLEMHVENDDGFIRKRMKGDGTNVPRDQVGVLHTNHMLD